MVPHEFLWLYFLFCYGTLATIKLLLYLNIVPVIQSAGYGGDGGGVWQRHLLQTHIFAVSLICNYDEDYGVEHRPLALPRTIHR